MRLGKELATGFVADDAQATAAGEGGLPLDGADAEEPEGAALPAPEPEPTPAGVSRAGQKGR